MTMTVKSMETARRNVAWRIAKFIKALEGAGREPTAWESHYVWKALKDREHKHYAIGEESIHWAEQPTVFDTPVYPKVLPPDAHIATTAQLRDELGRVYEGRL